MTFEDFIARYQFNTDALLGEGAFSKVYKAYDRTRGRDVVIKVMDISEKVKPFRLMQEVEKAQQIPEHRNVAFYESCHTFRHPHYGERDYAVMQYYPEGNLADFVKNTVLSEEKKIALIRELLEGIAHLHRHKVIHRDLKPQNVLLAKDPEGKFAPKITDFGLSKSAQDAAFSQVSLSLVGGTPVWSAPEQFDTKTQHIRHNADLWSLGAIAYFLFTAEAPFNWDGLSGNVFQAPAKLDIIPEPYKAMIERCLIVNPVERVASATECMEIIGREGIPVPAHEDEEVKPKMYYFSPTPAPKLKFVKLEEERRALMWIFYFLRTWFGASMGGLGIIFTGLFLISIIAGFSYLLGISINWPPFLDELLEGDYLGLGFRSNFFFTFLLIGFLFMAFVLHFPLLDVGGKILHLTMEAEEDFRFTSEKVFINGQWFWLSEDGSLPGNVTREFSRGEILRISIFPKSNVIYAIEKIAPSPEEEDTLVLNLQNQS